MAEGSVVEGFGKVLLGGAVGFGLYMLISNLGFGGRGAGRGEGHGEGPPIPTPQPVPTPPPAPTPPPKPKDEKRLSFRLSSKGFELLDADRKSADGKTYTLDEVIARVKEGGRSDLELAVSGGARQGDVDKAREAFQRADLKVEISEKHATARVSGNARGEYGRRAGWENYQ